MILADGQIAAAVDDGTIVIKPFHREYLGPNSYDVHLAPWIRVYHDITLDCAKEMQSFERKMDDTGMILYPGRLYLASTVEYTETDYHVPFLDGKSSLGRLGVRIHATAGRGDVGFHGHWTLEIDVVQPIRIYPRMPIGQIIFHEAYRPTYPYGASPANVGMYGEAHQEPESRPVASRFFKHFPIKDL